MSKFVINGGKKLEGSIEVRGAKNATFPLLAASLLTDEDCVIKNVPLIEDVLKMIKILKSIGVDVQQPEERTLVLNASGLNLDKVKKDLVKKLRGSVLFYGPLLARLGELELPPPGGCLIGARPIDTHLDAFEQLGVNVEQEGQTYNLTKEREGSTTCVLNEMSVTGTENAILLSALSPYETTIKIADLDYPVQQLLTFLQKMGVEVKTGHHEITIKGKEDLEGAEHTIMSDPIEAGTFVLTGLATNSEITVKGVERDFLELFLKKLKQAGANFELEGKNLKLNHWDKLEIDEVQSLPFPGLHTDLQSAWAVAATQAEGSTLIHDPLYEGRFRYLEELTRMGADILFADPHRVVVGGPSDLYGKDLGSFDLRGGAALIIAALMAEGKSSIEDTYQIDRGYEKIEQRLQKLGADIKRVEN
ncbi:MAG: UDP-N-acetylglucosamine 1-carboxyvinyltransferase [Candidatus Paceibacterota bacterium]